MAAADPASSYAILLDRDTSRKKRDKGNAGQQPSEEDRGKEGQQPSGHEGTVAEIAAEGESRLCHLALCLT